MIGVFDDLMIGASVNFPPYPREVTRDGAGGEVKLGGDVTRSEPLRDEQEYLKLAFAERLVRFLISHAARGDERFTDGVREI